MGQTLDAAALAWASADERTPAISAPPPPGPAEPATLPAGVMRVRDGADGWGVSTIVRHGDSRGHPCKRCPFRTDAVGIRGAMPAHHAGASAQQRDHASQEHRGDEHGHHDQGCRAKASADEFRVVGHRDLLHGQARRRIAK
ncbi:hypothetical protein GCM10010140_76870 [Streptosporangium pseudovulgare]|uniref:Uncharacterized protein n=1 Tax=Streptosporangium pseudovulgare TaxID=35765 RepID=A0ABQ2RMC9_9ACTN|nr:hypothetical protein GCM10010140_76870 [Streptosporangium pseudovulgare]